MIKKTCRRLAEVMCVLAVSGSANAALLTINPFNQTVTEGEVVTVDIAISGLGDGSAPSLGSYDFNLDFNPAVLSFSSVVFGDPVVGKSVGSVRHRHRRNPNPGPRLNQSF